MRVLLTDEEYSKLKEFYGGNLDLLKITLSIKELSKLLNYIRSKKNIDNDFIFKSALEEVYTTKREKELNKNKEKIIPLDVLKYNLEIMALQKTNGNIELSCKELGISIRTFYRDIKRFSINLNDYKIKEE